MNSCLQEAPAAPGLDQLHSEHGSLPDTGATMSTDSAFRLSLHTQTDGIGPDHQTAAQPTNLALHGAALFQSYIDSIKVRQPATKPHKGHLHSFTSESAIYCVCTSPHSYMLA